ncbi:lytic transglycosylase domain-containing protein [Gluconacetobacter tumulisoli]|uniref:Lytic transglycosylase domain-containing protein n=1 Tax=Gluconacetobacter tumulisoli TaxID=1286189 RepID=A0A7W4PMB1_9PROT|nr:lytic transglycosylase domain-containing protein [Gluconacetobacter tumulisoli]MBB2201459.1 lytic transglycosylase domain-containing protein [Gluconacetobacter tumulisoli]
MPIPLLACMIASAVRYDLPPRVLPVIQKIEGGAAGTVRRDTDGSADLGLMQINTRWVQPLAAIVHMPAAQTAARLVSDSCFNIAAAALILRSYVTEERGDVMHAIGDYHSHTPSLNATYQQKALAAAHAMFPGPD